MLAVLCSLLAVVGATLGDARLQVAFDAETGWPTTWSVDGETLIDRDPKTVTPVRVNDFKPWEHLEKSAPKAVAERFERISDTCARSQLRVGDWHFAVTVELDPNELMVRRRFAFCWDGAAPTQKLERLWFEGGKFLTSTNAASFMLPGTWPPRSRSVPFHDGWSQRCGSGTAGGPAPIICDNGTGWSALACLDETTACSDRGQSLLTERVDGLTLSTLYETCGRLRKGDWQEVGDAWFVFRRGTAEQMLTEGLPKWFRHVGEVPPEDRPDWIKDTVLYSTHPKGLWDEGGMDRGGFKAEADSLPFLKALGVNTIWLRPVEDEACYVPRDYYALMKGIGSEDDFKAYVRRAHALGMRVMRDGVIHGGFSTARNPRAIAHPEWVGRYYDGSKADFWCFDFNWPTWIDYIGTYIRNQTAKYDLDGWRLDATSGSRHPNWNPAIPYARASYAQLQGALHQLRNIRRNMKAVQPNGALLTESHFGAFAHDTDSVYDEWSMAVRVMDEMAQDGASGPVRKLRRWFHEQQYALPPDLLNMRYIDNHDMISAADTHGRAAATAMMAVMAWTPGFPQLCNFRENGAFEAIRRIFAIRAALPELRRGTAEYLGVDAADGIFACRRTLGDLESVFYVNFNSETTDGIPPFGYRIVRTKGPSVAAALGDLLPFVPSVTASRVEPKTSSGLAFDVVVNGRTIPVLAELRNWTNGVIQTPYRLVREPTTFGWRIRLAEPIRGRKGFADLKLVVQTPTAERWYARTAEGTFESPFRVRHPDFNAVNAKYTLGGAPRDGAMCWQSKTHPFGLTRETAAVGVTVGAAALEYYGFENAADVRVWDRLGRDCGLAVSVYGPTLESYAIALDLTTAESAIDGVMSCPQDCGDQRLKVIPGGWRFEGGSLRVNVLRNGAIASIFRKRNGTWQKIVGEAGFFTDTGTGRKVNTGEIPSVCRQAFECECPVKIRRTADGSIRLDFIHGELRAAGHHSSRMAKPILFSTRYTFKDDATFGYCTTFETARTFAKDEGILDWRMELVNCRGDDISNQTAVLKLQNDTKVSLAFSQWAGQHPCKLLRKGNSLRVIWLDKTLQSPLDLSHAVNGFTATFQVSP